jgi:hypothetical protein
VAASNGFGDGFFDEILGRTSNPVREFMGSFAPTTSRPEPFFAPILSPSFGDFGNFFAPVRGPTLGPGGIQIKFEEGQKAKAQASGQPEAPVLEGPIARAQRQAREAKEKAQGGAPSAGGEGANVQVDPNNPLTQRAAQIAQEEGVDPNLFTRLIAVESNYNPRALSRAGAQGLAQLMPATAAGLGVTDPYDPEQSLRGGAKYLKQMMDRFKGNVDLALAAYNAGPGNVETYGGVPPFNDTQEYVRRVKGVPRDSQPAADPAARTATALPTPPAGVKPLRGITPYQYGEEGLATGAADYICGPVAAAAFVSTQGRTPTLREALDLARQQGLIDPTNGMHGVDSTVQLIRSLGGTATQGAVDKNQIIAEIQAGRPVIIDTDAGSRGHYFVIEGYNPEDDTFEFGNSARALRASRGNTRYTLDNLSSLGFGAPHAAIYAR